MSYGERALTPEQWQKMEAVEQREWDKLCASKWYNEEISERVKLAVKQVPPFKLYRLVSTGHLVKIQQYDEKKNDENEPITVTVVASPEYNSEIKIAAQGMFGVPLGELQPVGLLYVLSLEKRLEKAKAAKFGGAKLIDPRRREQVKPNA